MGTLAVNLLLEQFLSDLGPRAVDPVNANRVIGRVNALRPPDAATSGGRLARDDRWAWASVAPDFVNCGYAV
jgi:hypothetical protein